MSIVSEHIERLILRGLDDELTEEQRQELEAALAESSEVRALAAEYERIDQECDAALAAVMKSTASDGSSNHRMAVTDGSETGTTVAGAATEADVRRNRVNGRRQLSWVVPAALAAALALLVAPTIWRSIGRGGEESQRHGLVKGLPPSQWGPGPSTAKPFEIAPETAGHQNLLAEGGPRLSPTRQDGLVMPAGYARPSVDRAINQESLYIVGDDGRIYVIDQQWVRTARQPQQDSGIRLASGGL